MRRLPAASAPTLGGAGRAGLRHARPAARGRPCYVAGVRDPYEVLGVPRDASEADIRAAFRKVAALHHPDKNPDDPHAHARFTEANAAHQILSDPQKRAAWDRFGAAAFQPGGAAAGGQVFVQVGLDGLFGDLLGALGIRTGERGDIRERVTVSFEQAASGTRKTLHYDCRELCSDCDGSGGARGAEVSTCSACSGRGRVRFQQGLLPFAVERPCSRCSGRGRVAASTCAGCRGAGLRKVRRSAEVEIPAGIESGASRIVEGAGHRVRPDRAPGNLEILIEVESHPFFTRVGDDVVCKVPLTFAQAALGSEIEVPTLDGRATLRVPPATQPGHVLRMRGKGIVHRVRGGRGDQLVEVGIEVPTELTERARELIEQLASELGEDVQPQQRTFLEKLKGWFG